MTGRFGITNSQWREPATLAWDEDIAQMIGRFSRSSTSMTNTMSDPSDLNIVTADALTLLLHNQHSLGAAIKEISHWISGNGADMVPITPLQPSKRLIEMPK